MKRADIYGTDPQEMAERIASEALNPASVKDDIWGSTFSQEARAKGNTPQHEDPTAEEKNEGAGNDSRATSKDNC